MVEVVVGASQLAMSAPSIRPRRTPPFSSPSVTRRAHSTLSAGPLAALLMSAPCTSAASARLRATAPQSARSGPRDERSSFRAAERRLCDWYGRLGPVGGGWCWDRLGWPSPVEAGLRSSLRTSLLRCHISDLRSHLHVGGEHDVDHQGAHESVVVRRQVGQEVAAGLWVGGWIRLVAGAVGA